MHDEVVLSNAYPANCLIESEKLVQQQLHGTDQQRFSAAKMSLLLDTHKPAFHAGRTQQGYHAQHAYQHTTLRGVSTSKANILLEILSFDNLAKI